MARLVWTPRARQDLLEIGLLIASDNPDAADRILTRIGDRAELLRLNPRIGQRRPDIRRTIRVLVERPYLILYRLHPDTHDGPVDSVELVRVIDGRRDLKHLF